MKQISFLVLFILLFLSGCQREEVVAPGQNVAGVKEYLWMVRSVDCGLQTKGVAVKDKLWTPGDTIRIKFLPGGSDSPALEQKVKQYAAIWLQYACLYFEYVSATEEADVKIGFDLDERCISWSVTGTDCRAVPQNECSLNFFELGLYGEENDRAEVLRGFGHVLGLGFEHRNPDSPIVFNSRAESYFRDVCRLTQQDIADLLLVYNAEQTNHTTYDELSIMQLDLPRIVLTSPHTMISSNGDLSAMDKEFVAELYPLVDEALVTMKTVNRQFVMRVEYVTDIQVDWGDGSIEVNVFEHTYADSVEHTIRLQGEPFAVKELDVASNGLTYLKVDRCKGLETLYCNHNLLAKLDVGENALLRNLGCQMNQLTTIDLRHNTELVQLFCLWNPVTQLDLGNNTKLEHLVCSELRLRELDLSRQVGLVFLSCSGCMLEHLDLSNNLDLKDLDCSNNLLHSLDLSHNLNLSGLMISSNPFLNDDAELVEFIDRLPSRSIEQGYMYVGDSGVADKIRPMLAGKNWNVY